MALPMFGCLAAGRLVQTNLEQVGAAKYVFVLPDAKSIHHVVVFLTGAQPFAPGYGATVHFGWPGADGQIGWQYLGFLSNDKPSAVFRVSAYKAAIALEESAMVEGTIPAHIGLAVEPIEAVHATAAAALGANTTSLVPRATMDTAPPLDVPLMARRLAEHLFNYVSSYLGTRPDDALLRLLQNWFQLIERRLKTDPDFWKRDLV